MHSFSFEAIGTHWTIDLSKKNNQTEARVLNLIDEFDLNYSRFRKDSYFSKISKKIGVYKAPSDFPPLKEIYTKLYQDTEGLFTPIIGTLLEEAGYDSAYSLVPKKLKKVKKIDDVLRFSEDSIEILQPTTIDFGAAGKGYLVDKISHFFDEEGIKKYIIDAGGDIYTRGRKKVKIALEHPAKPEQAIGVCQISNLSICSSSGNRRKWGNFHHILNPTTLSSSNKVLATWVVAEKTLEADGLATALFLLPNPELYKDFKFEYVILYKDYRAIISEDFPGYLFTV